MKKVFIFLVSILLSCSFCKAIVLEGKITYNVDSARKVSFEGIQRTIPVSTFQSHLSDCNFQENKDFIKYGIQPKDRNIEVFTKGKLKIAYSVNYKNNPNYSYYYLKLNGALLFIDIDKEKPKNQKTKYPIIVHRYDIQGKLISAGIHVAEEEGFLYDKNEKLIIHRIGKYGYNEKGRRIWKAEEIEF